MGIEGRLFAIVDALIFDGRPNKLLREPPNWPTCLFARLPERLMFATDTDLNKKDKLIHISWHMYVKFILHNFCEKTFSAVIY